VYCTCWLQLLGCLRPLSSGRPKILAHVAGIQVFGTFFIVHGFLDGVNLLGTGEFSGGSARGIGLGGLSRSWNVRFRWCSRFIGTNGSIGVVRVGILGAIASHVALEVTPEAPAFLGELGMFFQGELLKLSDIGRINIHWDMIQVRLLLARLV
jgi:hypothetical protein